jgi:hypothetical protein
MTKERLAAKVHGYRCALETPAATCLLLPEGTSATTMKNRILRIAAELGMPVTIRRVRGGLSPVTNGILMLRHPLSFTRS